jgi:1-acyl-sn-glycerol-3-phosphate acyltransferase
MALKLIYGDRRFWPLFWTQFLGALNDNFFKNALVILITYKSISLFGMGHELLVPLAGGIFILPFFSFSATSGQVADHYDKDTVIRWSKIAEVVIMMLAAIGLYFDNYQVLFAVLFLMGAQSSFFGPLKYGIIPFLVKEEELVSANALTSTGTFIAILIGTIMGGAVLALDNVTTALSIGLVFLAVLGLVTALKIPRVPSVDPNLKVDYTFIRPTWEILKITAKNRVVFRSVLGVSWFWFMGAAILSLLPSLCKSVFGADNSVATLFLACFTVGMGAGAAFTEKISGKKVEIGIVPLAAVGMSIFLADLFFVGRAWAPLLEGAALVDVKTFLGDFNGMRALFDLFMISFFGGAYIVPQMTYVQERCPREELSRTIAGNNIWNSLFMVVASVAVMLMAPLGIPTTFLILAGVNFVASFFLYACYSEYTLRLWMWFFTKVMYRVEVKGAENIPQNGSVILACNHVSFVDWMILMATLRRPIHFVIDWIYYYMPTGPFWFSQAKLIPIATKKESEEVLEKAFEEMGKRLDQGAVLGIFPEGWLSRDGKLRRFQPGIQKILRKHPVPVVAVGIDGLWGGVFSWSGGKVFFKMPKSFRPVVRLTFSPPMAAQEYEAEKAERLVASYVSHYGEGAEDA